MELFDTHVHLDSAAFDPDREDVIARARTAGVTRFVSIGAGAGPAANSGDTAQTVERTPLASARQAIELAERLPYVWASVGVHPHDATIASADTFSLHATALRRAAAHPRVVAIGETGLDFHYDLAPRDDQARWFTEQIAIARESKKPLIIHSRNAGEECLELLTTNGAAEVGGVFHCYGESAEFAARLRAIRFMVSIPGIVTFKKADALRAAVAAIPLEQIMLETDAPYLAPEPFRGKRCESSFMVRTAEAIATAKGLTLEELARVTTANAIRFFNLGGARA